MPKKQAKKPPARNFVLETVTKSKGRGKNKVTTATAKKERFQKRLFCLPINAPAKGKKGKAATKFQCFTSLEDATAAFAVGLADLPVPVPARKPVFSPANAAAYEAAMEGLRGALPARGMRERGLRGTPAEHARREAELRALAAEQKKRRAAQYAINQTLGLAEENHQWATNPAWPDGPRRVDVPWAGLRGTPEEHQARAMALRAYKSRVARALWSPEYQPTDLEKAHLLEQHTTLRNLIHENESWMDGEPVLVPGYANTDHVLNRLGVRGQE